MRSLEGDAMTTRDTILLVNDIPDHMWSYEAAFRARGYDVQLTTNAADTLAAAPQLRPQCLVIDVRLPDMSGWELCRRLKAHSATAHIPVVMLAPDASRQSLQHSRLAGCASWLMRPSSPDDVVRAVEHVLAHGAGHPELHNALIDSRPCPACDSDDVRGGVRVGPVQYFLCKACNMRWRVEAAGEATA
jgi:CheY-like chemotaxis protein